MRAYSYTFLFFLITCICNAQNSLNKDTLNTAEDFKIKREFRLSKELNETSGIIYIDSLALSFNDSGNKPILFGVDPASGVLKYRWEISNVKNNDWEDIAQDNEFIYIGDFGNNFGKRKNLAIYKIPKKVLFLPGNNYIEAEIINFSFEDQTDYTPSFYQHSFDCEAMICRGDNIFIFSKDWKNIKTTYYTLPKKPGTHIAKKGKTFDTKGLITGADYDKDKNILILSGYLNFHPFIWIYKDFSGTDFFSGTSQRIDLEKLSGIQNEGICFYKNNSILMSSEKKNRPATLFIIEINNL